MKFDFFKVMQLITIGMSAAESFKGKKGKQKLDHAINVADALIPHVESIVGSDLLKDERIRPFAEKYVAAAIDLKHIIENIKGLKADAPVSDSEERTD